MARPRGPMRAGGGEQRGAALAGKVGSQALDTQAWDAPRLGVALGVAVLSGRVHHLRARAFA